MQGESSCIFSAAREAQGVPFIKIKINFSSAFGKGTGRPAAKGERIMAEVKPGTGGDHDIPYEERKGNESIVYFTRDLSAEGLKKIYEKISET